MKKASNWLWGGVLVAVGVILGINALGIMRIDIFFPGWWTLFIIVPCLVGLFTNEHKGGAVIGLIVGVCLLMSSLGVMPFGIMWKLLLPAILIVIGVTVMVRGGENGEVADKIAKARRDQAGRHIVEAEVVVSDEDDEDEKEDEGGGDDNDEKAEGSESEKSEEKVEGGSENNNDEYWSTFSDQNVNYDGKEFKGCKVDAVFGGADIDLRGAKIRNESIVKASSIFGGIIIYVPEDVRVEVASTAIFGGVSDKRKNKVETPKTTLYIEATCVFGGVEIR